MDSLKTAATGTSNSNGLSQTQHQIPSYIFQNAATGLKSFGRSHLSLKEFYRLCSVREIEALLCCLVASPFQWQNRNPRRRQCSPNHMMSHTFTTWPPALRCHKLSSALSSDQQIDNKCCCADPLPPPSLLAKCFQDEKISIETVGSAQRDNTIF